MKKMSPEKFEEIKKQQLALLDAVEKEASDVISWAREYRELLNSGASQEEVFSWSVENDIESELEHIELFE